jgi:glc operon protein GlcG
MLEAYGNVCANRAVSCNRRVRAWKCRQLLSAAHLGPSLASGLDRTATRAGDARLQNRFRTVNSAKAERIRHTLHMAHSYGPAITLDSAKQAAAAAVAEARRNGWAMVVAVVDISGELVYFEKMDDSQNGSVKVAVAKARSAALFKRPTKAFQDTLTAGGDGLRVLALEGAVPVEGGVPLVVNDRIVGAIGVSGGTSQQDGECAKAGVGAM